VRRDDGSPVALGGREPPAVLVLHVNEPVSAERLVQCLWGEDAPAGSARTVQVYVSRLRKALGPETVATTAAGYRVNAGAGWTSSASSGCWRAAGRR
jgi:DNA-binding SARP family transcriptional activator